MNENRDAPTHFAKRKRKKKKAVLPCGGFQKASFRIKYYPYASVETLSGCCGFENVWVEILSGTEGLNLLFEYPEQTFGFFLSFFCENVYPKCSYELGF